AERARAEGLLALGEQEEALLSAERAQALAPSAEGAVILAEVAVIRAGAEQEALAQAALVAAREAQDPTLEARAHLSLAEVYGGRE
ncbi:MAG TPA: hypothetical protein DEA08_14530, partial [Planctomycetes bacterium]|nr:hypothetical protein [Planctomycetota bacterium]